MEKMSSKLTNHSASYGSGRTEPGPGSATQLARDYLRERLYGNSKQGFIDMKPYPSQIVQVGSKRRFRTHKNPLRNDLWPGVIEAEKQAEKERGRRRHKRKRRPSDLTLPPSNTIFQSPSGKVPGGPQESSASRLRCDGSFGYENHLGAEHDSSRRYSLYRNGDEPSVADVREKRAAIVLGELERVIPPSKFALRDLRAAARPHALTWATLSGPVDTSFPNPPEISPPNSSSSVSPQHKYTSTPPSSYSSANRLAVPHAPALSNLPNSADVSQSGHRRSALSSLAFSADLLDSTRRTITSAIRRSAEKTVHSFSHRSNDANYPDDDEESFYCIGEPLLPAFHLTETIPSPVSSFTSSIHSSDLSLDSSGVTRGRRLYPENRGVWMDAETECRLCKRKFPAGPRGLCSSCEEEFKRPITSATKSRKLGSIFGQDPGLAPTIPLPKIPTTDAKAHTGDSATGLRLPSVEHRAKVVESPGYASQEAEVQSVLQTAMSLRTKNRLLRRKNLESMSREQDDEWNPPCLRVAYNNTAETALSDKVAREEKPKETVPTIEGGEHLAGRERRGSLIRGSHNRRRPNSRGEEAKHDQGIVRRDTSFYSFYDEILKDAKERPARRRDDGRG
ncbi:hypothetical protein VE01_09969 [Pseudogymnoascus verrucosus]|uniref:Uncharacterized protein n=1 Tax=Pseudogymnoascus verrucosus TaxID=342668 RepID=A0A1B8G8Q8_9PEZI|nr:uncharacterized protein VE01_09969 [Pseudogymnoascus verrucosus]OBT92216.2 hypothetical protein VE01_09969 [Pseudogymnoascus verrucosus]